MAKSRARRKPSLRSVKVAGHEGLPPIFRPARDIAGAGKRERPDGPQNINVDRLEWLLAHDCIEPHHHEAGRRLQRDWERAQITAGVSLVSSGGGSGSSGLSDTKCDALEAVNKARKSFGREWHRSTAWRIIELVVIDGASMEKAASRVGFNARGALPVLCVALDQLGAHYGLC